MFGSMFKRKEEEEEQEVTPEDTRPECTSVLVHMVSGKIFDILTNSINDDSKSYFFDDNEGDNFLIIPVHQIEYIEVGSTIKLPKGARFGFKEIKPVVQPDLSPKRNRLKEIK